MCGAGEYKCMLGGGCISNRVLCDGHYDCPDRSDEWDCLRITNRTATIRSECLVFILINKYLIFNTRRSAEGVWHPICSDGWDNSWSDLVCSQLGYSGQIGTVMMDAKEEVSWQKKVGVPLTPEPLPLFKDQEGKKCLSRENVAIECEQFGKHVRVLVP